MVANGNAHVLLVGVETWFQTAVARQDVVLLEHVDDNLTGFVGWQYFTKEIVRL